MNIFERVTKRYPNGAAGHLSVLIIWSVLGLAAVFAGQRFPPRFRRGPGPEPPGAHLTTGRIRPDSGQLAGARAGTGRPQPRGLERKPG